MMNARLTVRNIGPLEDVDIEIGKVNLFIGPQSSGKSTIAKLLSFCFWLEKNIIENQSAEHINNEFVNGQLFDYHRMGSYFGEDSYMKFVGDVLSFELVGKESFKIDIVGNLETLHNRKVAYIPAERNIVGISNITTLQLTDDYVRGFLFDWLLIRGKSGMETSLLDLDVKYVYDAKVGDVAILTNGKRIALSESSSGIQSLVPLLVYIKYATSWIYEHSNDLSFDKYRVIQNSYIKHLVRQAGDDAFITRIKENDTIMKAIHKTLSLMRTMDKDAMILDNGEDFSDTKNLIDRIARYHSTDLIIEEPELSLFPSTQYELVKYIIGMMNFDRGDRLVLATHSPYIMTSMNNLIEAGRVGVTNKDEVEEIISRRSMITYDGVCAWQVKKGTVSSIRDDEFGLISTDALDEASDKISSDFDKLLQI